MKNQIAFRRGYVVASEDKGGNSEATGYFYCPYVPIEGLPNQRAAMVIQAELMQLGFILDEAAFNNLQRQSRTELIAFHAEVLPLAKEIVGAKRKYSPFYKNFPADVMDMSTAELFWNAINHYLSNGTWEPEQELIDRGIEFEDTDFKKITAISLDDFMKIYVDLVSINQSLTADDKKVVEWFVETYGGSLPLVTPPFRETLCILAGLGVDVKLKTPTDVLRVAAYLSGGDVSLPSMPKFSVTLKDSWNKPVPWQLQEKAASIAEGRKAFLFKKFSRGERKTILSLLEGVLRWESFTSHDSELLPSRKVQKEGLQDMQVRLDRWKRLGEILHPGEYKAMFPKSAAAFKQLRNQRDIKIRTFAGEVELALRKSIAAALTVLEARPGELARRLDSLLRVATPNEQQLILKKFDETANRLSSKVLLELNDHFEKRLDDIPARTIMIKGRGSKSKTLPALPALPIEVVSTIQLIIQSTLRQQISELPPLGSVWIDERLHKMPMPTGMRSASSGVKTYPRGTRIPFGTAASTVRAFCHWYDVSGNFDIDLSALFLSSDLDTKGHISFTVLQNEKLGAYHSGDIRHRRGSCAEYIDINIQKALDSGIRYVAVTVYNFNSRAMAEVPECRAGIMMRDKPKSNEIFEARTVTNAAALVNQSSSVVPLILDLEAREYIWADIEIDQAYSYIENTKDQIIDVVKSLTNMSRGSAYDLIALHAELRGKIVSSKAKADLVFEFDDLVNNYERVAAFATW